MKRLAFTITALFVVGIASVPVTAQESGSSRRPMRARLYGDWQVKVAFGERQMDAILSFARDNEGHLTAQWISPWGVTDLKDVTLEENKLSFVQVVRFGDNEFTSNFTGTIDEGKLTGVLISDRGESAVEGQRAPRISRAVGNWAMTFKMGERDVTATLVIRADKEGTLKGEWQSPWGEHEIADLAYERGTLSFTRKSTFQSRQFESRFEGTLRGDTLSGTITSERGEMTVEGTRTGAPLIGTWSLELASEQGARKQRLVVHPDMSGLYGTIPVEKISLEDGKVTFKLVLRFGEREFEMNFAGTLEDSKLVGEMTTSRGATKVTGTKVVRPMQFFRRPGPNPA
ncbi:MAG TPA: hypothetical protein ENN87_06510 [Phycisphaerales bacterium]|nr:hypothetical protein [Phycisphaerales bacterium]